MKRQFAIATVLLTLVICAGHSTIAQADSWLSYPTVTDSGKFDAIAQWVSNECKPNAIGDIVVLYAQGGRNQAYSVQVFCRKGEGKLGGVIAASYLFDQGTFDGTEFSKAVLAGQKVAILLQYMGQRNGIYYLKQVAP